MPKPVPVIETLPPCAPAKGERLAIIGFTAVNITLTLLKIEFTVTVTGPVPFVTEFGTVATIWLLFQLLIELAAAPLNWTTLPPWVAPKFDPAIVTTVPAPPTTGPIPEINGVVPTIGNVLSKVAVSSAPLPLLTARPM